MATVTPWTTEGDCLGFEYVVRIGEVEVLREMSTSGIYHGGSLGTTGDSSTRPAEIYFPSQSPISIIMDEFPPMKAPDIRIYQTVRRGESGSLNKVLIWAGSVTGYQVVDETTRRVNAEGLSLNSSTGGLRMLWSRTCSHVLYDSRCGVEEGAHSLRTPGPDVVGPTTLRDPSLTTRPSGHFTGGQMVWNRVVQVPGTDGWTNPRSIVFQDRRPIVSHTGDKLEMEGGTAGVNYQGDVEYLPGCDRSLKMCTQRFNNARRFGGVFIDGRSPFDGNPVF